ncbi:MAG: pseudouridine-5'-phosphate glycosidase [Phycisphaerales bacterium]
MTDHVVVANEVLRALRAGTPIVALETAVVTHGLPRATMDDLRRAPTGDPTSRATALPRSFGDDDAWNQASPINLELARLLERVVRAGGATPATMAVIDGQLRIGLDEAALARLACDERAVKASARDLAAAMVHRRSAGLTVAGALRACDAVAAIEGDGARGDRGAAVPAPSIRVLATGGIGGAHRGWNHGADISADLFALARSPVCVVCSGAKSILDLPATLEMLDSLGVAVIGFRTSALPRFTSRSGDGPRLPQRLDDAAEIARLCDLHWRVARNPGAVVVMQEPPEAHAIDPGAAERATIEAERRAAERGVRGAELTPFLLGEIAALTNGRSLSANIALLEANARLAAWIASCAPRASADTTRVHRA